MPPYSEFIVFTDSSGGFEKIRLLQQFQLYDMGRQRSGYNFTLLEPRIILFYGNRYLFVICHICHRLMASASYLKGGEMHCCHCNALWSQGATHKKSIVWIVHSAQWSVQCKRSNTQFAVYSALSTVRVTLLWSQGASYTATHKKSIMCPVKYAVWCVQ